MEIRKVLNNNSVLVGEGTKDYIWIGTGIGYKRKPGQEADEKKIDRIFVLQKKSSERLMDLLQDIPMAYVILADEIIKYAKTEISYELSDTIYISLTDHIFNMIRLEKEGLTFTNQLFWEVRKFYRKEFSVGEMAIQLINAKFDVTLDMTEAANIAMHFINAELNTDGQVENINGLTRKIKDITEIIRMHNQIEVDGESLDFERFVTHLRFFFKRLEKVEVKNKGNPFFVYCTISFPHPPYACEDPWYSSIDRRQLAKRRPNVKGIPNKASMLYGINEKQNLNDWSEERFDELRATYLAMVSRFDAQLGMLKDKLKETELYDETTLVVFSDHGDYTGDYGITEKVQNCFEDPISNVPLLIKPAKGIAVTPRISKAQVELLDLPATLADLAGFKLSYTQFGESLLHAVSGDETHKDAVFCEGGRVHGETQAMELGHGPESTYWPRLSTQYSEGPEHTKAVMCKMGDYKYIMRLYETDELYDMVADPMEINNLAVDPAYQKIVQEMKNRVAEFYMATTDFVPMKRDKR